MTGQRAASPSPLMCSVKPAHYLAIGDSFFHSGCAVIEIVFPNLKPMDVGKITFVNNYTATLTVKMKVMEKSASGQTQVAWVTGVRRRTLMPKPHCETSSQSYFTLFPSDFVRPPNNVNALRFILRQPSPNWKTFTVEEIYVFPKVEEAHNSPVVQQRTETANDDTISSGWKLPEQAKVDGMPDPEDLSQNMRKMLTLFENAENSAPSVQLGRFDIDGSYEINLLSYTFRSCSSS